MARPPFIKSQALFSDIRSVALVANGAVHDYDLIAPLIRKYEKCVAVDGGLVHCHNMRIHPDLIIGDFDSIPVNLLHVYPDVPKEKFPIDKTESDLELAVWAVDTSSMQKIGFFGALEKRTDHTLSNLHLMCRFPDKIIIETESENIFAIAHSKEIACHPGQMISFIPLGEAKGVTSQGLKWELQRASVNKNFMSLSNVCLSSRVKITVETGDLICCLAKH